MSEPDGDELTPVRARLFARAAEALTPLLAELAPDVPAQVGFQTFIEKVKGMRPRPTQAPDPLDRLVSAFGLGGAEIRVLLLAALPELDALLAAHLRALHPLGHAQLTLGLALTSFGPELSERERARAAVEDGKGLAAGVFRMSPPSGSLDARELELAPGLVSVLLGGERWPEPLSAETRPVTLHGLGRFAAQPDVMRALDAIRDGEAATIVVRGPDEAVALARSVALVELAGRAFVSVDAPDAFPDVDRLVSVHARARGVVPIMAARALVSRRPFARDPGPVVLATSGPLAPAAGDRRSYYVQATSLELAERRELWSHLLPQFPAVAAAAARLGAEGKTATAIALELERRARGASVQEGLDACRELVFEHVAEALPPGVSVVTPCAGENDLVLAPSKQRLLDEALLRVRHQATVFDEWNILSSRRGARGVRALFVGPPGTGKTLAAEVTARRLGVKLFVIDLSRVASKWLGETERNLDEAFVAAERTSAVLMFDEADALFGARTRVGSSNDRYANLETAFLLQRLERYEGVAVLATNLRQNIDSAFLRRFELVLEFEEPNGDERRRIWELHLGAAPLQPDVDLGVIARAYPLAGGAIRSAAVTAAFAAAARGSGIRSSDITQAVKRELEKIGRPFPEAAVLAR